MEPVASYSTTEQALRQSAHRGETLDVSQLPDDERRVRAAVIYELCIGADTEKVHTKGVRLTGAFVDGLLDFEFATLQAPLILERCQLGDPSQPDEPSLILQQAAGSWISLHGCELHGDLEADQLHLKTSLSLENSTVAGEVRLLGACIGGDLSCSGGTFNNPGKDAVTCDRAQIGGGVFLRQGCTATGAIRLLGASIGGDLDCAGGTFNNPDKDALNCDNAKITGNVFLRHGCTVTGAVRLVGASIGGILALDGGTVTHADKDALTFDSAHITGNVFLCQGCSITGAVRMLGASIGGDLDCAGGTFNNPDKDALTCQSAQITGGVFLHEGCSITGAVRMPGATVKGRFSWQPDQSPSVTFLDLHQAAVNGLDDDLAAWPIRIDVGGFRYERFVAGAVTTTRQRLDWLARNHRYDPDPFAYLAHVYRDAGDTAAARKVLLESHNCEIKAAIQTHQRRWGRQFLRYTIGHGYAPWRILWLAGALLIIGLLVLSLAISRNVMVPTGQPVANAITDTVPLPVPSVQTCTDNYQCLEPWPNRVMYVIGVIVPVIDFKVSNTWRPSDTAGIGWRLALWSGTAIGWTLGAITVAGFTPIIRRD